MTPEDFLKLCKLKNDGGYDQIKEYIDKKGSFKTIKGPSGITPLHVAVRAQNIKIIKLLIEKGMNPSTRDETKLAKTSIIDAIERGLVEITLMLLSAPGFKPLKTKKRYNEFTALGKNETISLNDYKTITSKMIEIGLDAEALDSESLNLLLNAIKTENIERLNICINLKLDINNPERLPLKYALYKESPNNIIIKKLIDSGALLTYQGDTEWNTFNALHTSHYRDNIEIFEYLITHYNAQDTLTEETLQEIIGHKETEFLKFLWNIPMVHDYITQHKLYNALPHEIQEIFIF